MPHTYAVTYWATYENFPIALDDGRTSTVVIILNKPYDRELDKGTMHSVRGLIRKQLHADNEGVEIFIDLIAEAVVLREQ